MEVLNLLYCYTLYLNGRLKWFLPLGGSIGSDVTSVHTAVPPASVTHSAFIFSAAMDEKIVFLDFPHTKRNRLYVLSDMGPRF